MEQLNLENRNASEKKINNISAIENEQGKTPDLTLLYDASNKDFVCDDLNLADEIVATVRQLANWACNDCNNDQETYEDNIERSKSLFAEGFGDKNIKDMFNLHGLADHVEKQKIYLLDNLAWLSAWITPSSGDEQQLWCYILINEDNDFKLYKPVYQEKISPDRLYGMARGAKGNRYNIDALLEWN